jgi:cell division protein FtsI/penicillin-binding protein 2
VLGYLQYLAGLADDLARAMVAEPSLANRSHTEARQREEFLALLAKTFQTKTLSGIGDPAGAELPQQQPRSAEVRLCARVDELRVIEALRALDERRSSLQLDFVRRFDREYPERELTHGLVGHVETVWLDPADPERRQLHVRGVCGLEALPEVTAAPPTLRGYRRDGRGRAYFRAPVHEPAQPAVLHSTIDLDLQRAAVQELQSQAESVAVDGKGNNPKWGAMVLVEIATGDVLAAASWHRDVREPKGSAFTPYQSLFEPGSIVKPLVAAYALSAGLLDWDQEFDCTPGGAEYRERIGGLGRGIPVVDDHRCGKLFPHGILVQSSNIGASYIGLALSREHWRDYMDRYGIGHSLGLQLPHEARGGTNARSFAANIPLRQFRAFSAVSFSFGYEHMVSPMQIARAYLRMLRGFGSELRLCRAVADGEGTAELPISPAGEQFSPAVVAAVRAALADVVSSDPQATGSRLHANMLREQGIDLHGLVAGKTGTAVSEVRMPEHGKIKVRNASFVGFLPADAPRWLAVCVLQRDDNVLFYGGSYAAPPATRLLLQAQRLAERRQLQQELRVGLGGQARSSVATPEYSGWSGQAPETTAVGR